VDVGAGDGAYVIERARREPSTFAIAIDASPDALIAGAWRAHRERLANSAFLVEGVERLPATLAGVADEVTVHFPWGSLLRGLVDVDPAVIEPLAGLLRTGGELRVLVSATERDGVGSVNAATLLGRRSEYACVGLTLRSAREATAREVSESCSSWAKRLGVGRTRAAVFARYRRDAS
jgi:16S rRNA (adenine(1408)-N(1))-methyltransferase